MHQQNDRIPLRRHTLPHVETYDVTAQELRSIERESLDVGQDLQFASITLTAAISFLIALILTDIPSPKVFASFVAVTLATGVLSTAFFIRYFRKKRNTKSTIQEIKDRQVGPLGDEEHVIAPAELAELPSEPETPERSGGS
jgi:hypothetical protein